MPLLDHIIHINYIKGLAIVQIGNYHIGRAETAKQPVMDTGEAFLLWDQLVSRYDIIQISQIFQNFAHDHDFKYFMRKGIQETLEKQVNMLEKEMNTYQVPLPERPPKSVNLPANSAIMSDDMMFKQIFTGVQSFLDNHVRTIRSITTNDPLRHLLVEFAKEELDIFENLCKYGKTKGWLQVPPIMTMIQ